MRKYHVTVALSGLISHSVTIRLLDRLDTLWSIGESAARSTTLIILASVVEVTYLDYSSIPLFAVGIVQHRSGFQAK